MEGTIKILSSTVNKQYYYANDQVSIDGNYQLNTESGNLISINGSVYRSTELGKGEYMGNISGSMREGKMHYSFSDMTAADTAYALAAVADIEDYIHDKDK
jgi:hypothetical protein